MLENVTSVSDQEVHSAIASIDEIIAEARIGRPFILVDAEDRENEGDVIVPAQFADAASINFMAMHARGLICVAITKERARELRLKPMSDENAAVHQTAFTISIEAREGVTTGISAHDRARTIAVAVDPACSFADIVSPGHVFPLIAQDGGVLVRTGHTEAAVDISRLAGLNPAGVICEVMNADGTMARLPDLIRFSKQHRLKIGTIADLVAYRRRYERQVERVYEREFHSHYGEFVMTVFRNTIDGSEHVALRRGLISPDEPVLVRMHQVDMATDMLAQIDARQDYLASALRMVGAHDGPGVVVIICDPNRSSLSQRLKGIQKEAAREQSLRDYGVGAQILLDLGVRKLILLTFSQVKLAALAGYGLDIVERRPIERLREI